MISSFQVEKFRLFDRLEINRLNRVNLIVGKNNAGKTALLEALLLFSSRMSPDVMINLLESRKEHRMPEQPNFAGQYFSPLQHLFKGRKIPAIGEEGFKLSSNDKDVIHVKIGTLTERPTEEILEIGDYLTAEYYITFESMGSIFIIAPLGEKTVDRQALARFGSRRKNTISGQNIDIPRCRFVSARGIGEQDSSDLWDSISLTDLEEDVLEGLRIIEPELLRLAFVKMDHGVTHYCEAPDRIPVVRQNRSSTPVPLKSLGDGMIRIFHIVLSLVSAKGGMLLIDEFENGLHWEVQEKAWRIVFELAEKLNVQVFATTHSRDCVGSFSKVWQENPDKGAFIRLTKNHDKTIVTEYDTELLADSLEMDTEVR